MPLDPHLVPFVGLAAANEDAARNLTPQQTRQAVAAASARLPVRPTRIAGTRNLTIPGPGGALPARAYTPAGDGPFPVVVFFHGGGFVAYDIDTHDHVCRELCQGAGALVVSVAYRLAPEHKFPAATDDALAAVRWVGDHARDLGGDPARLGVAGDSAGANLATVTALRVRDEGGPRLSAQLLIYPAVDMADETSPSMRENANGYFLTEERLRSFGDAYLRTPDDARHPHASPLRAPSLHGLPPALIVTAEFDPLRDQGRAYADALNAAGVPARYLPGPGLIHGFANLTGFVPAAAQVMDAAAAWLHTALHEQVSA
ncbi:alpha/beta hydrolase [Deinococcus maricopensis]|uniref:Alpha/beta hydrolase fold-3 n=1 Tax=Deinococcus maricopensis (strain DSM 21211 / LMG 22137 / NRRL B-23946 / LB-34) TaxID=709986 RepID=E8U735_DEIML|nr:alpha/beta hydrolase [Deinococcus maricopensis]ADV66874.1 alpha/beta hydrolase fold-3 [Deinococcus maricopensis DSM 21211]